jgi:hypothetical protein
MVVWAVVSDEIKRAIELFSTREEAERQALPYGSQ